MSSKTPVSILNEYMLRMGEVPHYELIHDSAGHDTVFQYIINVGNVTATGTGRSKKEAKHNAAQKALEELAKSNVVIRTQLLFTSGITSNKGEVTDQDSSIASVAVSPYAEQVTENSVGALADLCAQHSLPPPVYDLADEYGPPHAKTFDIRCTVHSLQEHGISRTKKQAKHISAKHMIEKINEHLGMPSSAVLLNKPCSPAKSSPNTKNYKIAIDRYCSIKDKDHGGVVRENVSLSLGKCHLTIKELSGPQVTNIREKALSHNAEETLQKFADEQNFDLSYSYLASSADGQHVCAASLSTVPELLQFGSGNDMDSAREIASDSLLQALMTMLIK